MYPVSAVLTCSKLDTHQKIPGKKEIIDDVLIILISQSKYRCIHKALSSSHCVEKEFCSSETTIKRIRNEAFCLNDADSTNFSFLM